MDYIPVYENETEAGVVTVAPSRLQLLGVRTAPVERRPALSHTVRATGSLAVDERRLAAVTTKVEGWIEQLDVAATGEAVRKGQVLAWLYAPQLVAAEEEYLLASGMPVSHGCRAHARQAVPQHRDSSGRSAGRAKPRNESRLAGNGAGDMRSDAWARNLRPVGGYGQVIQDNAFALLGPVRTTLTR